MTPKSALDEGVPMADPAEIAAMHRALALAVINPDVPLGPNPRVGAVIIDDTGPVSEGYHRGAGTPHAEIDAMRRAGPRARGATAVITLEPCDHVGRTPPCSAALIEAGLSRVVFAQPDVSRLAHGGADRLRAAGVDVEGGVLAGEAAKINPVWTFALERGRPFVTWKFAATLDGRSAARDGTSQWITGPEARADVHAFRAACDAVVVGTGTAAEDNPRLTVRGSDGAALPYDRQPLRVVLGERDLPADLAVFDAAAPTLQLSTRDIPTALDRLAARHVHHVWLEGGPTLAASFVRCGLIDRIVAYLATTLLGAGRASIGDLGISTVGDMVRLRLSDVTQVGNDVRLVMDKET